MLFTVDAWPRIGDGSITATFRTWTKPQAKAGGRYRIGGMSIEADRVVQIPVGTLTDVDAHRAGEPDLDALLARLGDLDEDALVWRVDFHLIGLDDRIVLREQAGVTPDEIDAIRARLARFDKAGSGGPWTRNTLRLIERYPGIVSTKLAQHAKQERPAFKLNVRKLKELGLTESLGTGYRLSPRGEVILRSLE